MDTEVISGKVKPDVICAVLVGSDVIFVRVVNRGVIICENAGDPDTTSGPADDPIDTSKKEDAADNSTGTVVGPETAGVKSADSS
ncbi:hypothetical protein ElyMa_002101400 [Elysia marginata]|uniref:Uncharacterized protein n=1 Tax=Elysia marginata TaxID=1093978 RepID=A0AAV4FEU7_9GAST|nr:hypothetical protein ElyMa_002101400 [Elysia marginata]